MIASHALAAVAAERHHTLLADAHAARLAKQARSDPQRNGAITALGSLRGRAGRTRWIRRAAASQNAG